MDKGKSDLEKDFTPAISEEVSPAISKEVSPAVSEEVSPGWELAIDRILSKYVAVWLWSIIFGSNIGVGLSFVAYGQQLEKWQYLGFLLVLLQAIGLMAALISFVFQLRYLSNFLVPMFFHVGTLEKNVPDYKANTYLTQSVKFMIVAVGARVLMSLVEILYSSFMSYIRFS